MKCPTKEAIGTPGHPPYRCPGCPTSQRGPYRVIVADPPWLFKSNSAAKPGRNALAHYDCMSVDEIAAMPVHDYAAPDCVLFLWVTTPMLVIGAHLPVMEAWGFKPSGNGFLWIKTNHNGSLWIGTGLTTRKNCEFCLIGKRGRSVRRNASVEEVIIAPRREHSRKPEQFYERVERYAEGPYLELFARYRRHGWTCHGNEVSDEAQMTIPF